MINPKSQIVTVLTLVEGDYVEVGQFMKNDCLVSPTFPDLVPAPEELFAAAA